MTRDWQLAVELQNLHCWQFTSMLAWSAFFATLTTVIYQMASDTKHKEPGILEKKTFL